MPLPDANADRPTPPVGGRPIWVVPCHDLDHALSRFESAGFVLLAIGPADDPQWALLADGHGPYSTTLRLDSTAHGDQPYLEVEQGHGLTAADEDFPLDFVVTTPTGASRTPPPQPRFDEAGASGQWVVGRAGMRYRDLIPGRWGGQFIGSHIHIPDGGPVPDYVHYHHIDFQLIFCLSGWVRVVYQDQGEPFVLEPGDAVLQAPGIRHRVLEASDDLQVIEVSSPAEHATFVEHDLSLPNGVQPDQWYGGQRFVHHRSQHAPWKAVESGVRVQSLALEQATGDRYRASVLEVGPEAGPRSLPLARPADFELVVILDGSVALTTPTAPPTTVESGGALTMDDRFEGSLRSSTGTRLLRVSRHRT